MYYTCQVYNQLTKEMIGRRKSKQKNLLSDWNFELTREEIAHTLLILQTSENRQRNKAALNIFCG